MTWNYRLTKQTIGGETTFAIREVYYDPNGKIDGWTDHPVWPTGETQEDFQEVLTMYQAATLEEVLDLDALSEKP